MEFMIIAVISAFLKLSNAKGNCVHSFYNVSYPQ